MRFAKPMNAWQSRLEDTVARLIAEGVDRGVQAAIYLEGNLIAETAAGIAHPVTGAPVTPETLFPVFSVTKGITATVIHRLAERGKLSYEQRIADLWPEFGDHGKEGITLEHALRHTAGLSALPPGLPFGRMLDWDAACAALAQTEPASAPGTDFAYHAKTYGWLAGETARRADGRPFSQLVREEIAAPLGLRHLHIGLPAATSAAIAFLEEKERGYVAQPPFAELAGQPAKDVLAVNQQNCPEMHSACLPSSNGLMNARDIARHYAALLPGGVDGVELLPASRIARATEWQTRLDPAGAPATWGLGYMRIEFSFRGETIEGFGHGGYGGSMGFAFPKLKLAVGYTRNLLGPISGWEALLGTLPDSL